MNESRPIHGFDRPPLRRRRTWRRRLLTLSLSLLASLIVLAGGLELGARLFFTSPFGTEGDLVGMYANAEPGSVRTVPGWRGEFTVEGRTVPVALDALGLRSPEIAPRKQGELRVLCLGDSFTFGYGVAGDEAFPDVLRGLLADQLGRPVVTGNAGVPGYGTVEEARCLRRIAPAFDADVIVDIIYLGNDFTDDRVATRYVSGGFSMDGRWASLMLRSRRARLMLHSRAWMRWETWLMESASPWALQPTRSPQEEESFAGFPRRMNPDQCFAGLFMEVIDEQHSWDTAHPEPVVPRVLATTAQSLREMRAAAGSARLLVAIMPSWWHVHPADRLAALAAAGLDPADYRAGLAQERLIGVCAALGLPVVDLTPSFLALPDPSSVFLAEDRHLNVAGHRLVAEILAKKVAELVR